MQYNFTPTLNKPWSLIHPYQLPAVQKLCGTNFRDDIQKIILFGGSLSLAVHLESDLDLFVITDNPDRFDVYEKGPSTVPPPPSSSQ
jgi:hypothetical protein